MIIVTGGAGFIGSNVVAELNARGRADILVVDRRAANFDNLAGLRYAEFLDPEKFRAMIKQGELADVDAILHQGACADTTATDERYVMENNFEFSREILDFAIERKIPLVYASSAS